MGKYVNKGNADFSEARNQVYVDKSELIAFINKTLSTTAKMTCVSRSRRFGKSLALQMLYAYYDCSCDSHSLFDDLAIAKDSSYEQHLNKYYAIHWDITAFITGASSRDRIVDEMVERVLDDIKTEFPQVQYPKWETLLDVLLAVAVHTKRRFVMLIDEWDALFREASDKPELLEQYINLLRNLFKGDNTNRVFAGVYMTGILPIKSYGTQSALNNFRMYSMTDPEPLEQFFGFTEDEVQKICSQNGFDFQELSLWYDGYKMGNGGIGIFNPTSVMTVLVTRVCKGYWTRTESFESVKDLINMNFDGVKEALESMLAHRPTQVSVSTFGNDSNVINSKDELLTLLIHYGYLGYDALNQRAFIPNNEVRQELLQAVRNGNRPELVQMVRDSELLLQKTLEGDERFVAHQLQLLHSDKSAPRFYNDEQALRSLIHLAYIAAVDDYVQIQELPSGAGIADVVFIPRKGCDKPAMIVELKFNGSASGAIKQVHDRNYPQLVQKFTDRLLLVGVNYDQKSKLHECRIEKWGDSPSQSLSLSQIVTKLSLSSEQVRILFKTLDSPVSAKKLRAELGFRDSTYFKHKVIAPLVEEGIIAMTQPDKPTSPVQKYFLTQKGLMIFETEDEQM